MTARTRALLYIVISVGWLALGVVNLVRGHLGIGVLYVVLGVVCGSLALTVRLGRRSR